MMNSPVLERMKGRYRKGILELAQAGDAGSFGKNFGKLLVQLRMMKVETKLIFQSRLMRIAPDRTCEILCLTTAGTRWERPLPPPGGVAPPPACVRLGLAGIRSDGSSIPDRVGCRVEWANAKRFVTHL